MHAHSDYTIKIIGNDDDKTAIMDVISCKLKDNDKFDEDGVMEVEQTYDVVWLEDIQTLAAEMAKAAKECEFTIEGVVDTSESGGEYMDFKIQYKEGKLTSDSSCWYIEDSTDTYGDNYETYCEEKEYEEGEEPITQEEFDDIIKKHSGYFFILDRWKGTVALEVPLTKHEIISLEA